MALSICSGQTNSKWREIKTHGTVDFPAACYQDDLTEYPVSWHWHDELELILITKGSAQINAGNERLTLKAGEGLFINTGVLHSLQATDGESQLRSIVFHPRLIGGSPDSVFWQKYMRPLVTSATLQVVRLESFCEWQKESLSCLEAAWENCVKEIPGYEFCLREKLSRVVFLLSRNYTKPHNSASDKEIREGLRIKSMIEFINEHFHEEITVKAIAESAIISESECLRCFRNIIGTSPIQYLRSTRLQKAAELLAGTREKVTAIGTRCGFQDMSYFSKTFQKMYGLTPSEYRKEKGGTR